MALTIHYIGNVAFRQNKSPQWNKTYSGDMDTCSLTFQGAQYLMKVFLDSLTNYQTMTYLDEAGVSVTDNGMWLARWTTDDAAIFPSVTLQFEGFRGGGLPDPIYEDDINIQSASTTKQITDSTSPNYQKAVTLSIDYRCSRTTVTWAQKTNPGATNPYTTIRQPLSPTFGSNNITWYSYTGSINTQGDPSPPSTADATAVFNTFTLVNVTTSFSSKEVVPGKVWSCQAVNERILRGASS